MVLIRPGGPGDVEAGLAVLDGAVRWLVSRGNTAQWGSRPFSEIPECIVMAQEWAASGGLHLAESGGVVVGALVVGDSPTYVAAAAEPELYIDLLVTDHSPESRGVGSCLLEHARVLAVARGVGLLRVDCYAGNDGDLVRYYERQGFTATAPFTVQKSDGPWPGQLLERRLPGRP